MLKRTFLFSLGLWGMLSAGAQEVADSIRHVDMEGVTVRASRMGTQMKDLPQKVEIISGGLINALPSSNLSEVLKRATNLDIVQYPGLSATIGMRGFSPSAHSRSYTLVLINGKPSAVSNLASIGLDNIERIEIVKGPYSVLYGSDAMGGVVNLITKSGTGAPSGTVSAESGSFGYEKIAGNFTGVLSDKISFGLGYSHTEQRKDYRIGKHNLLSLSGIEKAILDSASYGDKMANSAWELNQVNGFLDYQVNRLWKANAEFIYSYGHDVGVPGNYWGTYGQTKKDISRLSLQANLERITGNNQFRFSPYYSKELDPNYSDNTDEGYINFESNVREYGFQLQDVQRWGKLSLLAGLDYKMYDYESDRWSDKGTPTYPYKPDNENGNTALFAQLMYSTDLIHVNAGVRYDHFRYRIDANEDLEASKADESYNTVNPSVGVRLSLTENLKFHASFGTAFSVPDAYKVAGKYSIFEYFPEWDYTYEASYIGNPDLEPEKSRTVDGGLKYVSDRNGLKIDLTYFYTVHDDKIVEDAIGENEYTYINANKSTMEGLELMSSFDLARLWNGTSQLELYANWTWMLRNEFEEDTDSGVETKDMLYTRKANGNFGIVYGPKSFLSLQLNGRYIGSRLETDSYDELRPGVPDHYYTGGGYEASDEVLKHPNYLLFDCSATYNFNRHLDFGIKVSNLLNDNYSEKDGYNMPGRSVTARLAYKF